MPSLVEIGPVVLEKKSKIGKVYRRTDRQTDGQTDRQTTDERRSEKLTWAFSSGELKTILKYALLLKTIYTIWVFLNKMKQRGQNSTYEIPYACNATQNFEIFSFYLWTFISHGNSYTTYFTYFTCMIRWDMVFFAIQHDPPHTPSPIKIHSGKSEVTVESNGSLASFS